MGIVHRLFQKEKLDRYLKADAHFSKTLTAKDLVMMGIGIVIGTGIFILPGTVAATKAGPGIMLSFVVAAVVCSLAAMCYAELSAALPVAGSAYSFGNVLFGEIVGWILGWSLILEYMLAVAAVATAWAAYFNSFIAGFGLHLPTALTGAYNPAGGTYVNLVAILIIALVTWLLHKGLTTSIRVNNAMVFVKVGVITLFLLIGAFYVKPANWNPLLPFGWKGVFTGSSTVFFAYLGFDVVSASAAEVKDPRKNMPRGIIGTLLVCTVLYIAVSAVLTGMAHYTKLDVANPVSYALTLVHQDWFAGLVSLGALAGMTTMILSTTYSSSRLVYSIGRDGLLPHFLAKVDKKTGGVNNALFAVAIIIALCAGFVPLDELTALVNTGTLLAFTFVSLGVIILRKRNDLKHSTGFKVPLYPLLPLLSAVACIYLLTQLELVTWIAAIIWFAIGLVIYFTYGLHHSKLTKHD